MKANNSKRYSKVFVTLSILLLVGFAGITFIVDPFFHYHMPWFGLNPIVHDEIYQNPGLAKHYDYDAIIVGSSMSENFVTTWFDEAYDVTTLKLTYSGSTMENLRIAIEMAAENQELKYVFGNIDYSTLTQDPNQTRFELPNYLYDNNPFNDTNYLLNKEVLFTETIQMYRNQDSSDPLPTAYVWYPVYQHQFSKETVISRLNLPYDYSEIEQQPAVVRDATQKAVSKLKNIILAHADTTFVFFYSPYSMASWYNQYQNSNLLVSLAEYEYSMQELLRLDNVELYFPSTYELITDLNAYKDSEHYNMDYQRLIFEEMSQGTHRLTLDNYQDYINNFREEILTCDFEALFQLEDE